MTARLLARRGIPVAGFTPHARAHGYKWIRRTTAATQKRRPCVDKNRTEGTKHEVKGAIKEGAGKLTGNKTKEVSGNIEKNAGKVQKAVGRAADQAREDTKKRY